MHHDCQFWWNWWLNFGIATATFSAVLVALFGDSIKARLFHSKLKISLRNSTGEKTQVQYYKTNEKNEQVLISEDARYYHMKVKNETTWPSSTQTQVLLQRVEQPGPDGKLQIKWDGEVPMEWMHQSLYPIARTIGPEAFCDLCSVVRSDSACLNLLPIIGPNSLVTKYIGKTILVLTLQAKGNEGESHLARIEITWDGLWEDLETEMVHHFVIKGITL